MKRFVSVLLVLLSAFVLCASPIRNVILVIGDGMGQNHVMAGEYYLSSGLCFSGWESVLVNTNSITENGNYTTTDSAAAATALATGTLTVNRHVGVDAAGSELVTIMDIAKAMGKATGVVTTDSLTGATPSGFSAHALSRSDDKTIFGSQMDSGNVDFLCASKIPSAADSDIPGKVAAAGYDYATTLEGLSSGQKVLGILDLATIKATVALSDAVTKALDYLDRDPDGFVLMVEQAHIDKYSHKNNIKGVLGSLESIDSTVRAIVSWIGDRDDTVVLVTADHETGGLQVSTSQKLGSKTKTQDGSPLYYKWKWDDHTDSPVWLFSYGEPAVSFMARSYPKGTVIKNTEIFSLMLRCLENDL